MILSYHPCYVGDENRLCAGRDPDDADASAMKRADAVILPQGCRQALFEMAAAHCRHFFPDYTRRFTFPGKIGQTALFRQHGAPHPDTVTFESMEDAYQHKKSGHATPPFGYPFVFKFTWSGEGENVWLVNNRMEFEQLIEKAASFENTGQKGFLLQRYVHTGGRSLRVVVIGETCRSYWRIQPDPARFGTQSAQGGIIDHRADMDLQKCAKDAVMDFCRKTGINLAGFDIVYDAAARNRQPLFLEINYYFGRRGLGGSEAFYALLCREIDGWLDHNVLKTK